MVSDPRGRTAADVADGTPDAPEEEEIATTVTGAVAGGIVGTAAMALFLFAARATVAPGFRVFAALADLAGTGSAVVGFLLFVAAGAVAWPLLYVTLGAYLPGSTRPLQATVFALFLWVGFAVAFAGQAGGGLVAFLALSLVAHVVYGLLLGLTLARFTGQYRTPEIPV